MMVIKFIKSKLRLRIILGKREDIERFDEARKRINSGDYSKAFILLADNQKERLGG